MSNSLIACESYYFAGVLLYSGYDLIEVRNQAGNQTVFVFETEQSDYDRLKKAFESEEGLAVANIRLYGTALKVLDTHQKEARRNEFGIWARPLEAS